jgi:lipase maturation factor
VSENEGAFPVSVLQRVNSFLVGNKTPADSYALVRLWLVRGLGFVYFVACSILFFQGVALWGKDGLLPIGSFADAVVDNFGGRGAAFWRLPSLIYFGHSDGLIWGLGLAGMVMAAMLMAGYANVFILLALWLVQLSFVNSGQLFYGYGWETQLLELTFLTCFLVPVFDPRLKRATAPPPRIVIWALRWMLFRLMLGAGLIKIRNDSCWRDLTCLIYHYETQPIPNPLSFFYHHMPPTFHYAGCLFNHFVELVVPFGYFGPAVVRRWAGLITIVFQCILISSGNLAWLNWVTLVMCIPCFDDAFLTRWLGKRFAFAPPEWKYSPVKMVVLSCFTAAVAWLSISPALNLINSEQAMNTSYSQWHLVNSYGAFGSVGRERYDVVIEATDEPKITEHTQWRPYEFKAAPGDVTRRPPLITPYHYHLDWQIWFSGMRPRLQEVWLLRLAVRLLENDPQITALFQSVPFPGKRPTYIKMDLYQYRFADLKDWPKQWWTREWIGEYMPPISLEHPLARRLRMKPD